MTAPSRSTYSKLLGTAAWIWLATVTVLGSIGAVELYRDPSLVSIPEFSALYLPLGLSHAVMISAFLTIPLGLGVGAGAVILLTRREDRGAAVLASFLAAIFFFSSGTASGLPSDWLRNFSTSIAVVVLATFLVVFPTGTFVPRWSIAAPVMAILISLATPELAATSRSLLSGPLTDRPLAFAAVSWAATIAVATAAQTLRYRRTSTRSERDQVRWVMFGLSALLVPPTLLLVGLTWWSPEPILIGLLVAVSALATLAFPAFVSIAVFRHHLYDIDRIVSRTVTYALVGVVVAMVYTLPVVVLPAMIGINNDLVVAGATLIAAAVFNPVRRRIQRTVDRRFNRARYDAEREVAGFADQLAEEMDLETVAHELSVVVGRTVAPASIHVWIRENS